MGYIITIDGGVATGKTEIAKIVADELDFLFLSTGKMYRIVSYYAIKHNISEDEKQIVKELKNIKILFKNNQLIFDGSDEDLNNEIVSLASSRVSQILKVRKYLNKMQLKIAKNKNIIIEGRDSGTEVFPQADIKFFLKVESEIAMKRRYKQLKDYNNEISIEEVRENIILRNKSDEGRTLAPLIPADNAIIIDTSSYNVDQIVDIILTEINKKFTNEK